ncbi:MAG: hypothetical protein M1825_004248 [Sarcosagium campestre]|nr:MAG: hypothetical protein M1825_004248 [Sarcosagium campestre]
MYSSLLTGLIACLSVVAALDPPALSQPPALENNLVNCSGDQTNMVKKAFVNMQKMAYESFNNRDDVNWNRLVQASQPPYIHRAASPQVRIFKLTPRVRWFGQCNGPAVQQAYVQLAKTPTPGNYNITCDSNDAATDCKNKTTFAFTLGDRDNKLNITLCSNWFQQPATDGCLDPNTLNPDGQMFAQDFVLLNQFAHGLSLPPSDPAGINPPSSYVGNGPQGNDAAGKAREFPCLSKGCIQSLSSANVADPSKAYLTQYVAQAYSYFGAAIRANASECRFGTL